MWRVSLQVRQSTLKDGFVALVLIVGNPCLLEMRGHFDHVILLTNAVLSLHYLWQSARRFSKLLLALFLGQMRLMHILHLFIGLCLCKLLSPFNWCMAI